MSLWPRPRWPRPLDLAAPAVVRDPYGTYAALRRRGPIHYLRRHDLWLVVSHAAVKEAFERPDLFSNAPYAGIDAVLLAADGPRHAAVRRVVGRNFSGRILATLEAVAEARAAAAPAGTFDAVDYALGISRDVAAALIGFDAAALAEILCAEEEAQKTPEPVPSLIQELDRLAPRASIFPRLAQCDVVPDAAERSSLVRLLWLAGTITTERVITRTLLILLQMPQLRARVLAEPQLLEPLIEEAMRLYPPEHSVPRRTVAPVVLAGTSIPGGAEVWLCVAAGNRDPDAFPDPEAIRFDRPAALHFSFGAGVHRCLGAQLARRVAAAAVRALLERDPAFTAAEPLDKLSWFATPTALCPSRLLVTVRPRQ
jgi:cytochrome P450